MREGEREDGRVGIHVTTMCGVTGKTGIEMEALTAASVTCLTVYDMCKAVDRGMEISDVRLLKKDGGKTGSGCGRSRFPQFGEVATGKAPGRGGTAGGFVDDLREPGGRAPQRERHFG